MTMTTEEKKEKMTNKLALSYVLEKCELPQDVKEKLENMIAQLEKKSSSPKKETKTQLENKKLCEIALSTLSYDERKTVSDVLKQTELFKEMELSTQKVTSLLKILVDTDKAIKIVEKGKSYFLKK